MPDPITRRDEGAGGAAFTRPNRRPARAPLRERYGPWAVVTGASSGIGEALARRLAADGLRLVLVARGGAQLRDLAADLSARHGVDTRVVAADLAHRDGATAVTSATADLDVGLLVAAAGFGTSGPFLTADPERELAMLDVNCRAVLLHALHFGRRFAARGRGGLVLLGSIVGYQGVPRAAHYAATKAYVQSLGEALHLELAPQGVDVLVSAPGPVHSGFAARADMQMGAALRPDDVARATLAALGRRGTVAPGALSKLLTYSLAPLPRWGRSRILAHVMRGMTRHQPDPALPVADAEAPA
jgi:short-subunit dehydrogenase